MSEIKLITHDDVEAFILNKNWKNLITGQGGNFVCFI